jgi:hypothetical protein
MEPNKLKPAVIGGVILGLIQAIPFLNFINCFCCLGAIGSGFLAAHLYNKSNGSRGVTPADGATLGALVGGIAAPIILVIGVPLGLLTQGAMLAIVQNLGGQIPTEAFGSGVAGGILGGIMWVILCAVFSTIGGLLASLVYKPTGGPGVPPPTYPGPGGPYNPGGPGAPPYGQGTPGGPYGQGGGQPPY